jgi:hypothetical protein
VVPKIKSYEVEMRSLNKSIKAESFGASGEKQGAFISSLFKQGLLFTFPQKYPTDWLAMVRTQDKVLAIPGFPL